MPALGPTLRSLYFNDGSLFYDMDNSLDKEYD